MAKDPAFLFYTNDFDSATKFFSHEQVGKYMRLLMAQHQHGHLTEKQMMHICGTHDEDVFLKFQKDADGKFFNERLQFESEKRRDYVKGRGVNRKKKDIKIISKSYQKHIIVDMENENENENKNEYEIDNENKKGGVGERKEVVDLPFAEVDFSNAWIAWKGYKKSEHRFNFKSTTSEKVSLHQLTLLSGNDSKKAIAIIAQSIANGWKGFFELKQNKNGTTKNELDSYRAEVEARANPKH